MLGYRNMRRLIDFQTVHRVTFQTQGKCIPYLLLYRIQISIPVNITLIYE